MVAGNAEMVRVGDRRGDDRRLVGHFRDRIDRQIQGRKGEAVGGIDPHARRAQPGRRRDGSSVDLAGADLRGAVLAGADLTGADLTDAQTEGAVTTDAVGIQSIPSGS